MDDKAMHRIMGITQEAIQSRGDEMEKWKLGEDRKVGAEGKSLNNQSFPERLSGPRKTDEKDRMSKTQIQNMTNLSRSTVWRWVNNSDWVHAEGKE